MITIILAIVVAVIVGLVVYWALGSWVALLIAFVAALITVCVSYFGAQLIEIILKKLWK